MKILCLHGYGQSEEQAIKTFSGIGDFFRKEYKATLYIPIAPFSVNSHGLAMTIFIFHAMHEM
jgi:hypothetical protein